MNNIAFEQFFNWLRTTNHTGPVGITAKFYVKDGQASKFLEAMKNNVDFSNSEKGVRLYKLHADCFNPLTFWLTEEWNTVSDLKNHFLSESYIKNAELTAGLLEEPVIQIGLYKPLD